MRNVLFLLLIGIAFACSTTRNLPDGERLYTGIHDLSIVQPDSLPMDPAVVEEIEAALSYPPNNALLGSSSKRIPLPVGLWMYNALVNRKGKVGRWFFEKLAAKPILISTVNPQVRAKVAKNLLHEYGYFSGSATYALISDPKDERKAKVDYRVWAGESYRYDSISYVRLRHRIDTLIQRKADEQLLHKGDLFNVTQLEAERQRIASLLRNNGYYYFRPDYISYRADTVRQRGLVDLRISTRPGLPRMVLRPWQIGNVMVALGGYRGEVPTDTVRYKDLTIAYEGKLRVRPKVLYERLKLHTGDLYTLRKEEQTRTNYSNLGIFRYSELQYTPRDTTRTCDTLDLQIRTAYDLPLDGELELNVTTKSNDQTGPGAVFSVTRRNIFGGGETFGVRMRGSYEWQTGKRVAGKASAINSWELGISGTLTLPHLLLPRRMQRERLYPASTAFRLYADQLNRAKFFKMLAFGGSAAYELQSSARSRHAFTPFQLTYSLLQRTTSEFDSIIAQNRALGQSLENQFIPSFSYTYTFDDTVGETCSHFWWQASVASAGLLTNGLYALAGHRFNERDKSLLGNKFAQFIKLTSELRYTYPLGDRSRLVGRLLGGIVYSYGNSVTTPYSEQFYIGGANSLRAFTIRSIGPGGFRPNDSRYGYLDQTGDLKLEANLEYRFPLMGDLNGALFVDAGNVWMLRADESREGGQLKGDRFLKDLALDVGLGLRYDMTFLVVRVDWGVGLHVPYETGKRGYYNIPHFRDAMGIHLAIGYPF